MPPGTSRQLVGHVKRTNFGFQLAKRLETLGFGKVRMLS